jgi:hydroxyacylglutathione hydrolase
LDNPFDLGEEVLLKLLIVGIFDTNCYILGCKETLEGMIIDPGTFSRQEEQRILDEVSRNKLNIKYILNTHGHPDHIAGNKSIKEATNAEILIHKDDALKLVDPILNGSQFIGIDITSPAADWSLEEGDIITVGKIQLEVIYTPGHSKGSISILGKGFVFTGDTLFAGSVGRTDKLDGSPNPDASWDDELHSIKAKLLTLPDEVKIFPGHGPASTIGKERRANPFLK